MIRFRPAPWLFKTLVLETFAMTKFRKPFYRADRGLWCVQLDGKQIKLGPDREKAFERYHALMRRPVEHRVVAEVVDRFLLLSC